MADPIKTDAQKAREELDRVINASKTAEMEAGGWIKTHWAWIIGLGAFGAGVILGHLV
jgi:hypothetical protein